MKRRISLLELAIFAFMALPCMIREAAAGESYALLVSVAEYDKTELRPLRFTRNDIFEFRDALSRTGWKPENIVLLHDDPKRLTDVRYLALAENIRTELKVLLSGLRSDDKLIIAFAGHGIQFSGEKESFFCPRDAKLTKRETLVSFADILKQLDDCPAGQKLLLVDACRNDPQSEVARSRSVVRLESSTRPQQLDVPKSLLAMFSCAAGQQSFEDPELKHGIFFNYVLKGWNGAADSNRDRQLTFRELESYVSLQTTQHARLSFKSAQTPQLKGELSGDWTLRTLASPPPRTTGNRVAQRLFNGTDLTGWKITSGDPNAWRVENGILTMSSQVRSNGWLTTDREFSDYSLRLEFQLSPGSNSGIGLHLQPGDGKNAEIQICDDTFPRFAEDKYTKTGGMWGLIKANPPAKLNPVNEWNTLDVTMSGRTVSVVVNGKRVLGSHFSRLKSLPENRTLAEQTPALDRSRGHVALQSHPGGTVKFRNILILEHGYKSIFNGRDLSGWSVDTGSPSNWTVSDGVLSGSATPQSASWLISDRDYGDLDLRCEFEVSSGANSGIAFNVLPGEERLSTRPVLFPEIQLQDETPGKSPHTAYNERSGALFGLAAKYPPRLGPVGSWNDLELRVIDRKVSVSINGLLTLESANLDDLQSHLEKFPGLARTSGRIGLQTRSGTVRFRNIRVR